MKQPWFRKELQQLLRQRPYAQFKDITDLAKRVVDSYLATHRTFESALTCYSDLCVTIDDIKVDTLQRIDRTEVSNALMQLVATHWVGRSTYTWDDWRTAETLTNSLEGAGDYSWHYPKLHTLAGSIANKLRTEEFARSIEIPGFAAQLFEQLHQQLPDFENDTSALVEELHAKRKYGVKPCYFQDGMFQRGSQAWVALDTSELGEAFDDKLHMYDEIMAQIILTDRRKITSLESVITMHQGANYRKYHQEVGIEPIFVWCIDHHGELMIVPGGGLDVRSIFEHQGRGLEYALLRYANILRLYDLVVPLAVIESCPELPNLGSGSLTDVFASGKKKRIKRLLDPRLVLPRLRSLTERPEELVKLMEQEIEQDIERTRAKRSRHTVTCFARRLPKGHKASPNALTLAAKEGIKLEPNETCVKRHERNKSQEYAHRPHRAVPRH